MTNRYLKVGLLMMASVVLVACGQESTTSKETQCSKTETVTETNQDSIKDLESNNEVTDATTDEDIKDLEAPEPELDPPAYEPAPGESNSNDIPPYEIDFQLTDDVINRYNTWSKSYIKETSEGAFVNTSDSNEFYRTVSEAHGYGMYILTKMSSVDTDVKDTFDQFIKYHENHRVGGTSLMMWRQDSSTTTKPLMDYDPNNATDGDLYIAYSLIQAYKIWGDESYKRLATDILTDILAYNYNDTDHIITLGNWVGKGTPEYQTFRSSDVIPKFYDEFYQFTGDTIWVTIKEHLLDYLNQVSQNSKSGLVSDFINVKDGKATVPTGSVIEAKTDGEYSWNAARVPMQLAYDLTSGESVKIINRMLQFFETQPHVFAGYTLDGKATVEYDSIAFGGLIEPILQKPEINDYNINTNYKHFSEESVTGINYYGDTLFLMGHLY